MIKKQTQTGVTLIEILITLMIISIGLLGLAAMQLHASRFNHSAYLRTQASYFTYDMYDRMRANRALAVNKTTYALGMNEDAASATNNCTSTSCNPAQMAAFDLDQWSQAVSTVLPNGDAEITFSEPAAGTIIVTINTQWQDSREKGARLENFIFKAEL